MDRFPRIAALVVLTAGVLLPGSARAQVTLPTPTPQPVAPAGGPTSIDMTAQGYVPGELLVGVRPSAAQASQAFSAASAMGVDVLQSFDVTGPDDDLEVLRVATLPGQEYAAANVIAQQPGVVYVEPNFYVYTADMPQQAPEQEPAVGQDVGIDLADYVAHVDPAYIITDPLYREQQWNMQRIGAARAWQEVFDSGFFAPPSGDVVVSVIDSGIDPTHPEFAGRLLPGYNYVDDINPDFEVFEPGPMRDGCGHGTHVAGILAAGLNDAIGLAGMAPVVKIDPRRALTDSCGGTIVDVASAIISATVDGADVINMSLQVGYDSSTMGAAIRYAASEGVLLVAAAGNNTMATSPVAYPGAYPEVMAVAALDYDDRRAFYSNAGPEVEIAAPGGGFTQDNILSAWSSQAVGRCGSANSLIAQGTPGSQYYYCERAGTSQASPLVAGVGALLLALDPSLTADQVRTILNRTASPLSEAQQYVGNGKVDALAAVRTLVPADIIPSPATYVTEVMSTTTPFTITLRLDNPSMTPVDFEAQLKVTAVPSVTVTGPSTPTAPALRLTSGTNARQSGSAIWGQPEYVTVKVSPTLGWSGVISASVLLSGRRADGSSVQDVAPIVVSFNQPLGRLFLPLILEGADAQSMAAAAQVKYWLEPTSETQRTNIDMTDASNVALTLPFPFPLGGTDHTTLRLFSDGYLVAPASAQAGVTWPYAPGQNVCLPEVGYPPQGIYGWWANLDPGAGNAGARISTFPVGSDRFVVEFRKIAAKNVEEPYTVTFQMVLHKNGDVTLNYSDVPVFTGMPERVTIGVEGTDSRFYSQILCTSGTDTIGWMPVDGQTLIIMAEEVY